MSACCGQSMWRPGSSTWRSACATCRWAVEWIYKEDTSFALWAREAGLQVVAGAALFEAQAVAQTRRFITDCGGLPAEL